MWHDCYQRARTGIDVVDVRQSDEYIQKRQQIENEYSVLELCSNRFLSLVFGRDPGHTVVEQAAGASLCFFSRVFGVATVDGFPAPIAEALTTSLRDTFFLGMASHFVLQNHPSRSRINEVQVNVLFEEFLRESISAEMKMRSYIKAANNIPKDIFEVQYGTIEPMIKNDLRVGFWKRGKVRSNYNNVFCSGILLPMLAELTASNL